MTRVLIVGKTRMDGGRKRCIGGLGIDNHRSYRLLTSIGKNHPKDTAFNIGDVWDLELRQVSHLQPPHTEDVLVANRRFVDSWTTCLSHFILEEIGVPQIYPEQLFDRKLRFSQNKRAFIWPGNKGLNYSTGFWRFRKTLHLCHDYGKSRYTYCDNDISCDLDDDDLRLDVAYVGCETPLNEIPAGTILRFSLARWEDKPCYLMLSGWFL